MSGLNELQLHWQFRHEEKGVLGQEVTTRPTFGNKELFEAGFEPNGYAIMLGFPIINPIENVKNFRISQP